MAVLEAAMTRAFCIFLLAIAANASAPAAAQKGRAPLLEAGVPLQFGAIVAGGRAGSITVRPDGSVRCDGLQCIGGARVGDFYVTGTKDFAVAVSVAPTVLRTSTGATMSASFTPSVTTLVLRPGNRQNRFTVGGTLRLAAQQAPGDYRGEYLVVLDYL